MSKSKWDTSDWWDWMLGQSDDSVVAELHSQAALLRECRVVVRKVVKAKEYVCTMGPLAFVPISIEAQALLRKPGAV